MCAGVHAEDPSHPNTHILPVLIFDVGSKGDSDKALLLDGLYKTAAFSDMVIGVSGWGG